MTPNAPAPVVDASLHAPGLHVTVEAPARLHLGFMDPAGTLGLVLVLRAIRGGWSYVGIDAVPEYAAMSRKRLEATGGVETP